MLGTINIVAFVPTRDSGRARSFYEGVLGLRFVKDDGFALVLDGNGIMVRVAKAPEFSPAPFTILGWQVTGIEKVVTGLRERGGSIREIWLPRTGQAGDLDGSDWRQGSLVQRSRREYSVSFRTCVRDFTILEPGIERQQEACSGRSARLVHDGK
jgi:catechol 2,3-dioxygenase-like lactoylglutathione lyase family enzyme